MSCTHPLTAWKPLSTHASKPVYFGKVRPIGEPTKEIKLPCRQCIGCLRSRQMDWSTRMMHEASLWEDNYFLTPTYDENNLPSDRSLIYRHFQLFMKKIRKHFTGLTIRFVVAGEYGEQLQRPHFHAIIYNLPLTDLELYSNNGGNKLYTSALIEKLWTFGGVKIGEVNATTCKYVAGYMLKELKSKNWEIEYTTLPDENGEIIKRTKPFNHMSTRPGIGKAWFEKHSKDCFPSDFLIVEGKKVPVPGYYDLLYSRDYPEEFEKIQQQREKNMQSESFIYNNTPERLATRTKIAEINQKRHLRDQDQQ